jgi:hypothetical protein
MTRYVTVFSIGMSLFLGGAMAGATEAPKDTEEELRPRLEVTVEKVQERLEEIGVKGWALHGGLAVAAGAQPDLERMRSGLAAAVAAWKNRRGTYAAALAAKRTLDEQQESVLVEIGILLTPTQRLALLGPTARGVS